MHGPLTLLRSQQRLPAATNLEEWDDAQRRYWDRLAPGYDDLYCDPRSMRENSAVRAGLARFVPGKHLRVLDVACGTGLGAELLVGVGAEFDYVALDISPRMLALASDRCPSCVALGRGTRDLAGIAAGSIDLALCLFSSFSYLPDPEDSLHRIAQLLAPGGLFFLSALNRVAVRRVLRLRVSRLEPYRSSGAPNIGLEAPAFTYRKAELVEAARACSLAVVAEIQASGLIPGPHTFPDRTERALRRLIPWGSHTHDLLFQKGGEG